MKETSNDLIYKLKNRAAILKNFDAATFNDLDDALMDFYEYFDNYYTDLEDNELDEYFDDNLYVDTDDLYVDLENEEVTVRQLLHDQRSIKKKKIRRARTTLQLLRWANPKRLSPHSVDKPQLTHRQTIFLQKFPQIIAVISHIPWRIIQQDDGSCLIIKRK